MMNTQQTELTYREGSIDDKAQLKHMGLVSFGQYFDILSPENRQKLEASLNDETKLEDLIRISTCFVCLDGEKIVGTAYFIPHGNAFDVFKDEWCYIRMVGVDPAYQGKGIAKMLTQFCIDKAKKTGERTMALHTSEIMRAARHIYESMGFKILFEMEQRLGVRYWVYTLDL